MPSKAALVLGLLLGLRGLSDGLVAASPGLVDGLLAGRLGFVPAAAAAGHSRDGRERAASNGDAGIESAQKQCTSFVRMLVRAHGVRARGLGRKANEASLKF